MMDCLWAGLPVISLLGKHYASRMGASIINGVGMYDDLVVNSLEKYEELVLELATNPDKLHSLKDKLWNKRDDARLFDIKTCAHDLEAVYQQMWMSVI
jgi:predicted O-linked N-acetylglucosamine transferase (SPINDLY family)